MSLHDVRNFKKEEQAQYFRDKERQRQLRNYLDQQVNDMRNKNYVEKIKEK